MKKIISILAFTSLLCCSCDYLDVVPEGKATEEDIWKTTEQADKFRYYLQTYMPNLIGYDWSPDQFAGDDFITGARGTTYYFSSKSLLYGEELTVEEGREIFKGQTYKLELLEEYAQQIGLE